MLPRRAKPEARSHTHGRRCVVRRTTSRAGGTDVRSSPTPMMRPKPPEMPAPHGSCCSPRPLPKSSSVRRRTTVRPTPPCNGAGSAQGFRGRSRAPPATPPSRAWHALGSRAASGFGRRPREDLECWVRLIWSPCSAATGTRQLPDDTAFSTSCLGPITRTVAGFREPGECHSHGERLLFIGGSFSTRGS
jgi:hypothetical protein